MAGQFVLGNSVAIAWRLEDKAAGYSNKVLGSPDSHEAVTPGSGHWSWVTRSSLRSGKDESAEQIRRVF